jgi:hypothetical protein
MIQLKEWEILWGEHKIPVTSDMVVMAMDKAVSAVTKEYSFNKVIKSDPRLQSDWEQSALILELVRHQFQALFEMEINSQVTMNIPRKRKPS